MVDLPMHMHRWSKSILHLQMTRFYPWFSCDSPSTYCITPRFPPGKARQMRTRQSCKRISWDLNHLICPHKKAGIWWRDWVRLVPSMNEVQVTNAWWCQAWSLQSCKSSTSYFSSRLLLPSSLLSWPFVEQSLPRDALLCWPLKIAGIKTVMERGIFVTAPPTPRKSIQCSIWRDETCSG